MIHDTNHKEFSLFRFLQINYISLYFLPLKEKCFPLQTKLMISCYIIKIMTAMHRSSYKHEKLYPSYHGKTPFSRDLLS